MLNVLRFRYWILLSGASKFHSLCKLCDCSSTNTTKTLGQDLPGSSMFPLDRRKPTIHNLSPIVLQWHAPIYSYTQYTSITKHDLIIINYNLKHASQTSNMAGCSNSIVSYWATVVMGMVLHDYISSYNSRIMFLRYRVKSWEWLWFAILKSITEIFLWSQNSRRWVLSCWHIRLMDNTWILSTTKQLIFNPLTI